MWKTGWRLLLILLLVAFFVSFGGREAAAKRGAELVNQIQNNRSAVSCSI